MDEDEEIDDEDEDNGEGENEDDDEDDDEDEDEEDDEDDDEDEDEDEADFDDEDNFWFPDEHIFFPGECENSSQCGQDMCNFDYGDHGFCESCANFQSAEDCQGTGFITRAGFENCIEVCAGGVNPNGLEWIGDDGDFDEDDFSGNDSSDDENDSDETDDDDEDDDEEDFIDEVLAPIFNSYDTVGDDVKELFQTEIF